MRDDAVPLLVACPNGEARLARSGTRSVLQFAGHDEVLRQTRLSRSLAWRLSRCLCFFLRPPLLLHRCCSAPRKRPKGERTRPPTRTFALFQLASLFDAGLSLLLGRP